MSSPSFDIVQIKCPRCKKIKSSKTIMRLNVDENPEYKKKVMDGSIFYFVCPSCDYALQLSYNFLYHSPKNSLLILLMPNNKKKWLNFEKVQKNFPNIKKYKKRVVSNIKELKEKILIFENNLDDRIIEKIKLSIIKHVNEKVRPNILDMYFCMYDEKVGQISFVIFLKNDEKYYYSISTKAYDRIKQSLKLKDYRKLDKKYFVYVKYSY